MADSKSTQTLKIVPTPTEPPGLNTAQYRAVCDEIACSADTLRSLLTMLREGCEEEWQRDAILGAAAQIATRIGAMADTAAMTGGDVFGDANFWNYGPLFNELGKEATA